MMMPSNSIAFSEFILYRLVGRLCETPVFTSQRRAQSPYNFQKPTSACLQRSASRPRREDAAALRADALHLRLMGGR
jgi:hypothetical protein